VTGAAGRIGRVLVPALRSAGFAVVAPTSAGAPGLDLADTASIRDAVRAARPEVVVNLGGVVGAASAADPERAQRVNVAGAAELALASRDEGAIVFVQASTAAVYGTDVDMPLREDGPLGGSGAYAETKREAEERLAGLARPGFTVVSARIFNVWGAHFPESLVARVARSGSAGVVELDGWTRFVRDYIHVDDVAAALAGLAVADPQSLPGTVNVATGEGVSNETLVALLEAAGVTPAYRVNGDKGSWSRADVGRLRGLGLAPRPLSALSSRARLRSLGGAEASAL
jgi:nucleoside-diphosphate-sugar epimerase